MYCRHFGFSDILLLFDADGDIDTAEWAYTEDQDSLDEMWSARRGCYYASCLHRRPSLLRPSPAERCVTRTVVEDWSCVILFFTLGGICVFASVIGNCTK